MRLELRPFRGRLAQFKAWSNRGEEWDTLWSSRLSNLREHLEHHSDLGEYQAFTRYLPRDLPILEAGCGLGTIVAALDAHGYQVEGVDYAVETVHRVREAGPHLSIRVGDIYDLDVPDHTYGGYISLGVLEHNPRGPLDGLREAKRVLHPQGVAFISVPFLNAKRARILESRLKSAAPTESAEDSNFYQFYFSIEDFRQQLTAAGLRVVEFFPIGVNWGLLYDYSWIAWIRKERCLHWRMSALFDRCCRSAPRTFRMRHAHMMMYVCRS